MDRSIPQEEEERERFAALVTAHSRAMFRAARAILDDDADAEDAVVEAVLLGWQSFRRLRRPEAAQASVEEWLSLAEDSYTLSTTAQETHNGQDFTALTYTFPSGSAYAQGASAFTVYDGCAVSVEVACQDAFTPSPSAILSHFLDHCHYAPLS